MIYQKFRYKKSAHRHVDVDVNVDKENKNAWGALENEFVSAFDKYKDNFFLDDELYKWLEAVNQKFDENKINPFVLPYINEFISPEVYKRALVYYKIYLSTKDTGRNKNINGDNIDLKLNATEKRRV